MDLVTPGDDVVDVVVDDALQVEEIRGLALQLAGALGDATRKRALNVLRIEQHSRYKDRALNCGVNSQTCMDPSTANCSRGSLRAILEDVEVLPQRVVFPERLLWFCRLLFTMQMRVCAFRTLIYIMPLYR